jgi:hypothetical protein
MRVMCDDRPKEPLLVAAPNRWRSSEEMPRERAADAPHATRRDIPFATWIRGPAVRREALPQIVSFGVSTSCGAARRARRVLRVKVQSALCSPRSRRRAERTLSECLCSWAVSHRGLGPLFHGAGGVGFGPVRSGPRGEAHSASLARGAIARVRQSGERQPPSGRPRGRSAACP